ncbi:hypothetical protein Vi05172_g1481 [Venturia inaequalis]|nr:hypothetical protein Vi05172_g1481 [Venturia inaequalis]
MLPVPIFLAVSSFAICRGTSVDLQINCHFTTKSRFTVPTDDQYR